MADNTRLRDIYPMPADYAWPGDVTSEPYINVRDLPPEVLAGLVPQELNPAAPAIAPAAIDSLGLPAPALPKPQPNPLVDMLRTGLEYSDMITPAPVGISKLIPVGRDYSEQPDPFKSYLAATGQFGSTAARGIQQLAESAAQRTPRQAFADVTKGVTPYPLRPVVNAIMPEAPAGTVDPASMWAQGANKVADVFKTAANVAKERAEAPDLRVTTANRMGDVKNARTAAEYVLNTFGSAAGSIVPLVATSVATGAYGTVPLLGSLGVGSIRNAFDEAGVDWSANEDVLYPAAAVYAGLEYIPGVSAVKSLLKGEAKEAFDKTILQAVLRGFRKGGAREGATEALQTATEITSAIYAQSRDVGRAIGAAWDDVLKGTDSKILEAWLQGRIGGGLFEGGARGANRAAMQPQPAPPTGRENGQLPTVPPPVSPGPETVSTVPETGQPTGQPDELEQLMSANPQFAAWLQSIEQPPEVPAMPVEQPAPVAAEPAPARPDPVFDQDAWQEAYRLGTAPAPGEPVISSTVFAERNPAGEPGIKTLSINGETVSAATVNRDADGNLVITRVDTLPGARRQGYATQLVDDLLAEFPGTRIATSAQTDVGRPFFARYATRDGSLAPRDSNEPLFAVGGRMDEDNEFDVGQDETPAWYDDAIARDAQNQRQREAGRVAPARREVDPVEQETRRIMSQAADMETQLKAQGRTDDEIAAEMSRAFRSPVSPEAIRTGQTWWSVGAERPTLASLIDDDLKALHAQGGMTRAEMADALSEKHNRPISAAAVNERAAALNLKAPTLEWTPEMEARLLAENQARVPQGQIAARVSEVAQRPISRGTIRNRLEKLLGSGRSARAWPAEAVARVAEMKAVGARHAEIKRVLADEYGVDFSENAIGKRAAALGLARRNAKWSPELRAEAAAMDEAGRRIDEIATTLAQKYRQRITPRAVESILLRERGPVRPNRETVISALERPEVAAMSHTGAARAVSEIIGRPISRDAIRRARGALRRRQAIDQTDSEPMYAIGSWRDWFGGNRNGENQADLGRPGGNGEVVQPLEGRGQEPAGGQPGTQEAVEGRQDGRLGGREGKNARRVPVRGGTGFVAERVRSDGLRERNYYVYSPNTEAMADAAASVEGVPESFLRGSIGNWWSRAKIVEYADGWRVDEARTRRDRRGAGLGTDLHRTMEADIGGSLLPQYEMTADDYRWWRQRDPEAVRGYLKFDDKFFDKTVLQSLKLAADRIALTPILQSMTTDEKKQIRAAQRDSAALAKILPDTASLDDSEPLFAIGDEPSSSVAALGSHDAKVISRIERQLKSGRPATVSPAAVQEALDAIEPDIDLAPARTIVAAVSKIEPDALNPDHVMVRAQRPDGTIVSARMRWDVVKESRSIFLPGKRPAILAINFGTTGRDGRGQQPGSGLVGEVAKEDFVLGDVLRADFRHELIHLLRTTRALDGARWQRLLDHAMSLRLLDLDITIPASQRVLARELGAEPNQTVGDAYKSRYANYAESQELIDQEAVASLMELSWLGALTDADLAPVRDILDDISKGNLVGNRVADASGPLFSIRSSDEIDAATGQSMRRDLDSLGFYSKALDAARGLKQEKGTPEQMMAQLKKAGVKDAEIQATGLDRLLKSGSTTALESDAITLSQNAQEEVWGPRFQNMMLQEYRKAVAGEDLSTQLDILTAKYFNAKNDPPEMRAAMGQEIMRLRNELGPEWMAKYAPDAQPVVPLLSQQQGDRTASPTRRALLNQITKAEIIKHLEDGEKSLTDKVKQSVMEDGQPMFAMRGDPVLSMDLRNVAARELANMREVKVPRRVVREVHNEMMKHVEMMPPDQTAGVLVSIKPLTAPSSTGAIDSLATFEDADGNLFDIRANANTLLDMNAVYVPDIGAIAINPLSGAKDTIFGLRGKLGHELVHSLRSDGHFAAPDWARLVAHGNLLDVLGMTNAEYRRITANYSSTDMATRRAIYDRLYDKRTNKDEIVDQETVAHMLQLYVHGHWTDEQIAPVRDLLDSILDGSYARGKQGAAPQMADDLLAAIDMDNQGIPSTPGLDMSREARLARAEEMGFDTSRVWYVSTLQPITKFNPTGKFMGHKGLSGISVASTPELANRYLERFGENDYKGRPFNKSVMAVYLRPGTVETRSKPIYSGVPLGAPLTKDYSWPKSLDGVDTVIFPDRITKRGDVAHLPDDTLRPYLEGEEAIIRDPSNIRSVNAAFDPSLSDSPQLMAAFAGRNAKTADLEALSRAKEMDSQGTPREDIWNETGWFKGVDGEWRFEIDDSGSRLNLGPGQISGNLTGERRDVIRHPDLDAAYPDAAKVRTQVEIASDAPREGQYFPDLSLSASARTPRDARSVALHEAQHDIQHREGFATGTSRSRAQRVFNEDDYSVFDTRRELADARNRLASMKSLDPGFDDALAEVRRLETALDRYGAMEGYRRSAGETEARTVQKRMDMKPDERKARPPWLDYDVPEDQQIVSRKGGEAQSIEELPSIVSIIRSYGGIKGSPDLRQLVGKPGTKGYIPGIINDKRGVSLNRIREALIEAGHIVEDPDRPSQIGDNEILDMIETAINKKPKAKELGIDDQNDSIINQAVAFYETNGMHYFLTDAEEKRLIDHVRGGMALDDAIEQVAMETFHAHDEEDAKYRAEHRRSAPDHRQDQAGVTAAPDPRRETGVPPDSRPSQAEDWIRRLGEALKDDPAVWMARLSRALDPIRPLSSYLETPAYKRMRPPPLPRNL